MSEGTNHALAVGSHSGDRWQSTSGSRYYHREEKVEEQSVRQIRLKGRPVCFIFERASAPRHFLLGNGNPMRKL